MDKISAIKSVPISSIISKFVTLQRFGIHHKASCPFHQERTPSFVVTDHKGMYCCFGCFAHGDAINFVEQYRKVSTSEAIEECFRLLNGRIQANGLRPPMKQPAIEPTLPAVPLDWNERVSKLSDDMLAHMSEWRGYPLEFCYWLRDRKIIGSYADAFCFPVYNRGHVVRFHVRWPSGAWQYKPDRVASDLTPLVIGPAKPYRIWAGESQWDIFAVMSCLPMDYVNDCRWIATRGVSNGGGVADYILRQRDDTEAKRENEQRWADRWPGAWSIWPKIGKDCNDWLQEDSDGMRIKLADLLGEV